MRYDKREQRYYWVKIREGLMYSDEVKLLMRQPDGGWYFSIYIYLIMLSINSNGKLIRRVGEMEMIYDLTSITQELMFFKIDTIRVAIKMLIALNLMYEDEQNILCISNFDKLVGSETGWAESKRLAREKKLSENNVRRQCPQNVHANVHPDIREKRLDNKNKILDNRSINHDNYDNYDNYDNVTLSSDSFKPINFTNFLINEWHLEFKKAHVLTKYLVHSNYIDKGDLENLLAANDFFEKYLNNFYEFYDLKNHVQYFLMQYRKLSEIEKSKIENKIGYLTTSIKNNQRSLEWRNSTEFKELQGIDEAVAKLLKEKAKELYPEDDLKQDIFYNENYLQVFLDESNKIKQKFRKKLPSKS